MALMSNQLQGSYATFGTRSLPRKKIFESKQIGRIVSVVRGRDKFISLQCKYKSFRRVGTLFFLGPAKVLKITSFKGTGQSEESSGEFRSKNLKNSVNLSYVQQASEETLTELLQEVPVTSSSATDETTEGPQAIQGLFKNWLTLLRTPSPNQVVDDALEEPSSSGEMTEMQNSGRSEILKVVWYYFWDLDAMIKIFLLIFLPLFLAINVVHGAAVSKELTPLWVLGPIIVSLYIKMFRAICALYAFTLKQTVKVVKDVSTYYAVARNFTAPGKLKESMGEVFDIKSLNFKKVSERMKKDFNDWLMEKYFDFIESIWPTYCRTIRFMKRANLI